MSNHNEPKVVTGEDLLKQYTPLNVSEIFYSIQGEGRNAGSPAIFIRLQGCKTQHACYASGIRCDTEFESGKPMTVEEIEKWITDNVGERCDFIIWTGGEPLDQLTETHTYHFHGRFFQAVETSGLQPPIKYVDFYSISPKVAEHVIYKNWSDFIAEHQGNFVEFELRYVRHKGQAIPEPSIQVDYYWLSPHSDGHLLNRENLQHCIQLCKDNTKWHLSIQQHKLWNVL